MTSTPHDALFRSIFSQPPQARAELRAVVPAALLQRLDLDSLTALDGTFLDESLRATSADLLFAVRQRRGGDAFVYFLFEHQSTGDPQMALRMLIYLTRIWERHAALHPERQRRPPIVPVLIHQGPRPWPWPTRFVASQIDADDDFAAQLAPLHLDYGFVVDDLGSQTDGELLARGDDAIARLTLIALRNGRDHPRLLEHVAEMTRALEVDLRGPTVVEALHRLARYVFHVSDRPLPEVFATIGAAAGPEPRRCLMTIAERLMAAGGLAARRASLVEILETRFGAVAAGDRQRIEEAPVEQLVTWIRRAAVANAAREVFETA